MCPPTKINSQGDWMTHDDGSGNLNATNGSPTQNSESEVQTVPTVLKYARIRHRYTAAGGSNSTECVRNRKTNTAVVFFFLFFNSAFCRDS